MCGTSWRYTLSNNYHTYRLQHAIIVMITLYHAGCPRIVRSDYGTENASLSGIQIAFRYQHRDSLRATKSFIYGPSRSNIVNHDIV